MFQAPDRRQRAAPGEERREEDLPAVFWHAEKPIMLMCSTPYVEVVRTLEEAGARVIEAMEDTRADPEWVFYYYVAGKS